MKIKVRFVVKYGDSFANAIRAPDVWSQVIQEIDRLTGGTNTEVFGWTKTEVIKHGKVMSTIEFSSIIGTEKFIIRVDYTPHYHYDADKNVIYKLKFDIPKTKYDLDIRSFSPPTKRSWFSWFSSNAI